MGEEFIREIIDFETSILLRVSELKKCDFSDKFLADPVNELFSVSLKEGACS